MSVNSSNASRDAYNAARDINFVTGDSTNDPDGSASQFSRARPIFIQYLNPEVLACYGISRNDPTVLGRAIHATRLAILLTDGYLIFPASYFYEVPCFPLFLNKTQDLIDAGVVRYSSHISDPMDYVDHKAGEYRADIANPYSQPKTASLVSSLPWHPRLAADTASDIAHDWHESLDLGALRAIEQSVAQRQRGRNSGRHLREVPDRLDGQAFIGRFVRGVLPFPLTIEERVRVDAFLSRSYLASYLSDLDANILADFTFGELTCGVERIGPAYRMRIVSARQLERSLQWMGIHDYILRGASWAELLAIGSSPEFGLIARRAAKIDDQFRVIIARTHRAKRYQASTTFDEVRSAVALVANELARHVHGSGSLEAIVHAGNVITLEGRPI